MTRNEEFMARLTADGMLEKLAMASASVPKTAAARRRVEVTSRKGRLSPKTTGKRAKVYGRRAMSPYQAAAMGSGYGVLPARDIQYHPDPQRVRIGWSASFETTSGRNTINQELPPSPFVHITFPEWVK